MEKLEEELVQSIVTVTQKDYFLESIDVLINNLFASHQTIFELTELSIALPYSQILNRLFREQNLLDQDKERARAILLSVKEMINKVEEIELRVALNVTEADVKDIRNWLYFQLKRHYFLNIIVDPTIVGGVVIYRNGTYKDYSISNYIDQYGRI